MTHVSVQSLSKGDVIIERGSGRPRMTPVTGVEFNACSTHGVHVNRNACYDFNAMVEVVQSDGTLGDLEEAVTEKWVEEMTDEELQEELTKELKSMADDLLYESISRLY